MKNVLVLDSDQAMLQTLTALLKSQGNFFNVFSVVKTKQAIQLLQQKTIDIVISVIRLPDFEGLRLIARITKDHPTTKVIIMTKNANPLLRARIKRFPSAIHFDLSQEIAMLTQRVFTELQIDYGGRIRGVHLSSFLQMMALESCTCTLIVNSKDLIGSIWLKNGELIAAKSENAEGKEAAFKILTWKNVFIDIDYAPSEVEHQISTPLMTLILESSLREDEMQNSVRNNRAYERFDLLLALDYDINNMARQCFLRDISLGGAYIETCQVETSQEVELEQTISLAFASRSLKSRCSIKAKVVRKDSIGVGVRFKFSSLEQQQVMSAMIDSYIKYNHNQEQKELSPAM